MDKRVLVTYATKAGSTAEVAAAVGQTLASRGFQVDVKPVKENPALDGYQAVILGSAVRVGNWLGEAVDYARANQSRLAQLPVALFTVHLSNTGDDEASRAAREAYTAPLRELLPDAGQAFFAGKVDYATLSFLDRLLTRAMAGKVGVPLGDHRDWDLINAWAMEVFA